MSLDQYLNVLRDISWNIETHTLNDIYYYHEKIIDSPEIIKFFTQPLLIDNFKLYF